jgi:Reverse transcriptase (RNA-dependent DNA polymerase)
LRRVVAKAACRLVSDKIVARLSPIQLGFGAANGTEAAVHAANHYLKHLERDRAMLKIDFTNAFNKLNRHRLLEFARIALPELFKFIECCYDIEPHLVFGEFLLSSAEGVQQVDPLGPLLFCLSIQPLLDALLHDVQIIKDDGAQYGLVLNDGKCE